MKVKRIIYFIFGAVFLSLGAIGAVLPFLPTTPFVIVAAFCFGRSSEMAEKWILSNKYFGAYIENYRNKVGIPLKIKVRSILFLWATLIVSMIYAWSLLNFVILLIVGIAISSHIYLLKTKQE
ncbi:MAG: YbaN family protein [Methanobrevibacter sp.]|jgi:uncharacterized membrane protein YbaN (DUF454 family)|nr:YbaN family protein [Candidatus Methanovirga australis]